MRIWIAVAAVVLFATAATQLPSAFLDHVEAGDVEHRAPEGDIDLTADPSMFSSEAIVCLNPSAYVLTFEANEPRRPIWFAALRVDLSDAPDNPAGIPQVAGVALSGNRDDPGDRSGWTLLHVQEPQCYRLRVVSGRARLYELTVGF